MPELKNWYVEKRFSRDGKDKFLVRGNVYHSSKFAMGEFITTSLIEQTINYRNEGRLEVHTLNSVYDCYWEDCVFDVGDTEKYLADYAYHRDEYLQKIGSQMKENSILLLVSDKGSLCFKQGLYKRNGKVESLNLCKEGDVRHYKILQSEEDDKDNIDIRLWEQGALDFIEVVYADIPEDMSVYVQNVGVLNTRLKVCQTEICIEAEEKLQLELVEKSNYRKMIKLCGNNKKCLPRRLELFRKEAVYPQIEEDTVNHIEKEYLVFTEHDYEDEEGKSCKNIHAGVGKGLEIAMMFGEYELAKRLVESGVPIELERLMLWSIFKEEGKEAGMNLELTFMELLSGEWGIPDDLYALIWQRAKEQGAIPLKKALHLQLQFSAQQSREIAIKAVKRLREQWEEAADELLLAWVKYYLSYFRSTETEIWEELFTTFPDKKKLIFEEIVAQHLRIYEDRSFFTYPREQNVVALPAYWKICSRNMEETVKKELIISVIHKVLEKEQDVPRIGTTVLAVVESGKKLQSDWLIYELLFQVKDFGDLQVELRDECIQKLLGYEEIDLKIWQMLLKSTFLPAEYLGFYIEELMKRERELGYILPLLITAKMQNASDESGNGGRKKSC